MTDNALSITQQRGLEINALHTMAREFSAYPMLSKEEEHDLAVRVASENDREAAEKLILSHMRYVISVAKGYINYGLPAQDIVQEGTVGLMKAVKNFSPDREVRLVSYATHWIKAAIHEYILKNWRLVKIASTKAQRKLFFNLRKLQEKIGTKTSAHKEIAEALNVPEKDVTEMAQRFSANEESLQTTLDDEDKAPKHLISYQNDNPADIVSRDISKKLLTENLYEALGKLDERHQLIVKKRWLAEEKVPLKTLAEELSISIERVRQLEKQALLSLHKQMEL